MQAGFPNLKTGKELSPCECMSISNTEPFEDHRKIPG